MPQGDVVDGLLPGGREFSHEKASSLE